MKKGLVHIYTGDGKGKTTTSVGLSVRALGHKLKVCYSYFHKKPDEYGYTEITNLEKLGAEVYGFAKDHPSHNNKITKEMLINECKEGLKFLSELIKTKEFDLLVMDEIIISVRDGFIEEQDLLDFVDNKPETLELVLTGRAATDKLIEKADYVSELKKIKHPYDKKIISRVGIEY